MTFLPTDPPRDEAAPKASASSALQGPRAPVTRWNRRYVLAGGVALAGVIALGFYIGFGGSWRPKEPTRTEAITTEAAPATSVISTRYPKGYGDPAVQSSALGTASLPLPPDPLATSSAAPHEVDPALQQAAAQSLAARAASPFFQATGGISAPSPPTTSLPTALATPTSSSSPAPAGPDVQPANGQGAKRAFIQSANVDDYLASPIREPESPWEVKAGTIISAALLTAINSDLPGEIIAQVTAPVYDHATGRVVLIPQGSRLIGQYDSQVAYGQERALLVWNRIIMPNGRSINIASMEGADLTGASGLHDQVDGHFWQLAKSMLLSTAFSIGAASSQDASARSSGDLVVNSAASGISQEATQVGSQITARDLNRQNTLKIRAGWPLGVLVNKDMVLAPYP